MEEPLKPVIIGISGHSCGGKNEATALLEKKGFFCIDADKISRSIFAEHEKEIYSIFSEKIKERGFALPEAREEDGQFKIDKKNFALMVFSEEVLLKKLEDFILPKITERVNIEIQKSFKAEPARPIVLNAPTLHKTDLIKKCKFIFFITAPKLLRIFRALKRDRLPLKKILARFSKQNEFFSQYFFLNADIVLVKNSGSIKNLENKLLQELKKRGF